MLSSFCPPPPPEPDCDGGGGRDGAAPLILDSAHRSTETGADLRLKLAARSVTTAQVCTAPIHTLQQGREQRRHHPSPDLPDPADPTRSLLAPTEGPTRPHWHWVNRLASAGGAGVSVKLFGGLRAQQRCGIQGPQSSNYANADKGRPHLHAAAKRRPRRTTLTLFRRPQPALQSRPAGRSWRTAPRGPSRTDVTSQPCPLCVRKRAARRQLVEEVTEPRSRSRRAEHVAFRGSERTRFLAFRGVVEAHLIGACDADTADALHGFPGIFRSLCSCGLFLDSL